MKLTSKNILRMIGGWVHDHPDGWLNVLGAIIGAITAAGAVLFANGLLRAEHWTEGLQGEWAWWMLPVIPMIGALLTGLLVYNFAREAGGARGASGFGCDCSQGREDPGADRIGQSHREYLHGGHRRVGGCRRADCADWSRDGFGDCAMDRRAASSYRDTGRMRCCCGDIEYF